MSANINLNSDSKTVIEYFTQNYNKYIFNTNNFGKSTEFIPKISLVVPTYQRSQNKNLLDNPLFWSIIAVLESKTIPEEIIIVENGYIKNIGHTKEICNFIESLIKKNNINTRIIYLKIKEINVSKARNEGLKKAKNKLVYLLDDDCILHKDAISLSFWLYNEYNSSEIYKNKVAVLALPQNKRSLIPFGITTKEKFGQINLNSFNFTGQYSAKFPLEYIGLSSTEIKNSPLSINNFQGGNILVNKDLLLSIGGYPDYLAPISYGEETGLSFNLRKKGLFILYSPFLNLTAVHLSYGNPIEPIQLIGEDREFKLAALNLSDMVKKSAQNRINTGARIENYIYIYTKILVFAKILDENEHSSQDWFNHVKDIFVIKNEPSFMDRKGNIELFDFRNKIFDLAVEDFAANKRRTSNEMRTIFNPFLSKI